MKLINLIPIFLIFLLISGCATIVSKSTYPVQVNSNPKGAKITIKSSKGVVVYMGETPTTVNLSAKSGYFKGENYTVTFESDDYPTFSAKIRREIDGWYILGNLIFGGILGYLVIDPATGAMWTLNDLYVDLGDQTVKDDNIKILTVDQVPPQLSGKLAKIKGSFTGSGSINYIRYSYGGYSTLQMTVNPSIGYFIQDNLALFGSLIFNRISDDWGNYSNTGLGLGSKYYYSNYYGGMSVFSIKPEYYRYGSRTDNHILLEIGYLHPLNNHVFIDFGVDYNLGLGSNKQKILTIGLGFANFF